jgi:hypothetical protein
MVLNKQTILYLSFFLLISLSPEHIPLPYYFPDYLADMIDHFKNKSYFGQFLAYVWGEKAFMTYKHIEWHNSLYLQHLFTPSGVHLSSLLILLKLSSKKGRIYHALEFLLLILTFIPVGLYPLKRIALFRLCSKINQLMFSKKFSEYSVFITAFAIDFFLGNYSQNPMSFALSYLFIGTLLLFDSKNLIRFFFTLFMAQILVSIIFFKPFYPIAFFIGMLLSALFALLFPLLIAGLLTYTFFPNFSEYFLALYTKILGFFYHPFVFKWEMLNHLLWLSLILIMSLKLDSRKKIVSMLLILLICPDLGNAPEKFSGFYQKKKYPQYVRRSLSDL